MGDFSFYFKEGMYHITDLKGYDHILFVLALCIPYLFKDAGRVLILITAFTIGHSITLALSVFDNILVAGKWVEFLIPVTIVLTALLNLFTNKNLHHSKWNYIAAMVFGFIHGLGFSNYLKSMLDRSENIVSKLLAFNIGLEIGQLLIVAAALSISFIFVQLLKVERKDWALFLSGAIVSVSLLMTIERNPF